MPIKFNRPAVTDSAPDLSESLSALRDKAPILAKLEKAPLGVVLGSGLGGLADAIESPTIVPYAEVPGLAPSTASGHRGEFLIGHLASRPIIAMAGRLHVYEGHSLRDVTRPVALMAGIGINELVVSCAAGGLNPQFKVGDLVLLSEHSSWLDGKLGAPPISLQQPNDLPNESNAAAKCFRRSLNTCDPQLDAIAHQTAHANGFELRRGMYLAVNGPNYETRAECRMMRQLGADLVGMSTVPELLCANSARVRTLGISVVTNLALPDAPATADHADVLEVCERAADRLQQIVRAIATHGA
ncbi:purine-nucleoside phosphorylase [Rhodopirellula baltica]|uniref:Purine nucleoside phosphorylase n=1 Tax=Rhodopirellula baltica SWK14 TaxID=993516 RepID=L7C9N0_RHOBT|nr:purine-nucleoside phosphorylase [Rhodopirellula baltica]ELP29821.1 Inosine guanosine and xanthosine phosphorylase [Rhodopirellula baltica SWK14]